MGQDADQMIGKNLWANFPKGQGAKLPVYVPDRQGYDSGAAE
jgi:hypothetical protein